MTAGGDAPGRNSTSEPVTARAGLADRLRDSGRAGAAVEAAFRAVPRHLFLPEIEPAQAYQDQAFVIKSDAGGMAVSASTSPSMMAIMLGQLGLAAGQRVLEIGTGTGYNAALIAHIVADQEAVVTVDIDAGLVDRASATLASAGYGQVRAVCGDGWHGVPGHAPYDRIILTAGAWDLAPQWLAQLAPGGRIVLPLSVRGIQLSVALERAADHWESRSACRCRFITLASTCAGPQPGTHARTIDWPAAADGPTLDAGALDQALSGPVSEASAGLRAAGVADLADLDLWLTLTEPSLTRLTPDEERASGTQLMPLGGLAGTCGGPGQLGAAALIPDRGPAQPRLAGSHERAGGHQLAPFEIVVRGFGPAGADLAGYLARQAVAWDELGRPGASSLALSAYPAGTTGYAETTGYKVIIDRPHARLVVGWPDV